MNVVACTVICMMAASTGFIAGVIVGDHIQKPDEISWQQGYNRGWRDGMKQAETEKKKKDGEQNE